MSLALVSRKAALLAPWNKNELWRRARAVPSLDLRCADNKSLVDATTGQNLVTFTRASSGTYVGSDGLIKTATTNLCLQSQDFSTTWTNFNSTESVNTATAPDGTLTADTLIPSNGATSGLIRQDFSGSTFTDNVSISFSIFVKAAGLTSFNIQFFNKANTFYGTQVINASTGALSGSGTLTTTTVTPVGDGWFRVSATGMNTGSGATSPNVRFVVTSTGDGTSGIYLWGAQLEQSSTVGEYIPTTSTINSAPRFDHNPTTGESLGLLVEESRTNLLQRSEEFDNVYWTKGGSTISANSATAPDGLTTADKLVEDTSTGNHRLFVATTSLAANTAHSLSVYVKAAGRSFIRVEVRDSVGAFAAQDFNLTTLAVASAGSGSGTIVPLGNGWYRCTATGTSSASGGLGTVLFWSLVSAGSTSYTGDGSSGLFLWGAQLEAGSFPTSYIPTTTATVTRSADVASISGSNFSSWYRQDEGTVFAETQLPAGSASNVSSRSIIDVTDGTTSNRFSLRGLVSTTTVDQLTVRSGGSTVAQVSSNGSAVSNAVRRLASAVKLDDYAIAATGSSSAVTDISGAMPISVNQARIGAEVGSTEVFCGTIRRLVYWPQRFANSTLQTITQ